MWPFGLFIPFDASVQHPEDDLLLQRPHPHQLGHTLGLHAEEFRLTLHFQDHRTQVGGRLLQEFYPGWNKRR